VSDGDPGSATHQSVFLCHLSTCTVIDDPTREIIHTALDAGRGVDGGADAGAAD
jgi:hypothetical protein